MDAWVFVFSRFTDEALLFECLIVCVLLFLYSSYALFRRRRQGYSDHEIPSQLIQVYLAQLIAEAEDLRNQLFGLLGKQNLDPQLKSFLEKLMGDQKDMGRRPGLPPASEAPANNGHPPKLDELERQLMEQALALDTVLSEKRKLEDEISTYRKMGSASEPKGTPTEEAKKLSEKIKSLESQLAEYAVIEDDLANLKRLQKENRTLKARLEEAGILDSAVGAAEGSPAVSMAVPAEAMMIAEAVPEAVAPAPAPDAAPMEEPSATTPASLTGAPAAPEDEAKLQADFEKLLNSSEPEEKK